ncbi:hypothetical protein TNCV_5008571 [Trichonephila clavipes]|nr:hypothetical protein TNCV_5008571 [Trichonephila clavipes]
MENADDLSDFNKGQVLTARCLGTSISKRCCSRTTVVSTYCKKYKDGETTSRRPEVYRSQRTDSREKRKLLRIVCHDQRAKTALACCSHYSGDPDTKCLNIKCPATEPRSSPTGLHESWTNGRKSRGPTNRNFWSIALVNVYEYTDI